MFKTDARGAITYNESYKVSGPALYTNSKGQYAFPIGSITMQETKAPTGYLINNEIYTVHFTLQANGDVRADKGSWNTTNECEDLNIVSKEQAVLGGLKITKTDKSTGTTPQLGLSFAGAKFEIRNANAVPVTIKGKTYAPGAVVMTLTTNKDGVCQTGKNDLVYGKYSIKEVKAPVGYTLNKTWNPTVSVTANGAFASITCQDTLIRQSLSTTARDAYTKDHVGTAIENAKIIDTVAFKNLINGRSYTIRGSLRYADTGVTITGKNGKPAVVSKTFTCDTSVTKVAGGKGHSTGTVDMPAFEFDGRNLGGRTLVVTEVLIDNTLGERVAAHYNLADEGQSINFIKIGTKASDENTGTRTAVTGRTTIIDKVTLKNLTPPLEYALKGKLVYLSDCVDANGVEHKKGEVITEHEPVKIVANATDMVVELKFTVDASALAGNSGVVFEDLWHNDIEVAVHHDYKAPPQTPQWPGVHTSAVDKTTGTHTGVADETATIVDTVTLTNLVVGDTYKVVGTLMNKDGSEFLVDGAKLTVASEKFTASASDMTVDIAFMFDASALGGQSLVVYEKLFFIKTEAGNETEIEVASHEDKDDENQTVDYLLGHTNAADGQTKDSVGTVGDTTIVDTVTYKNLHVGEEYTISGDLHYTADFTDVNGITHLRGDVVKDADGKEITASVTFTPTAKDGTVDLVYTLNSELLSGATIVVFENFYSNDVLVYTHNDLDDENQTIEYPGVKTTAFDKKSGTHIGTIDDGPTELVDKVELTNLVVGKTYTVFGTLMDKATGKPLLDKGGSPITAAADGFEATDKNMVIEVTFVILDPSIIYGKKTVVFEELLHKGVTVGYHKDIEDENQEVDFPGVETTLTDQATDTHTGHLDETITLVDVVSYTGLIPGREYVLSGKLMNKATGEALLINGREVTAEKTFTADKSSGTAAVEFTLDSRALAGTTVVAFEELRHEDILVAVHADIDDVDQSVTFPKLGTKASDKASGTKDMTLGDSVVLIDTISFTGLTPGKEYTVKGEIMDKATGQSIGVTASAVFTPETADGETTLEFTINTNRYHDKELVVFEAVYDAKGNLIGEHEDLSDEGQTVRVPGVPPYTPPRNVKAGDATNMLGWVLALLLSGSAIVLLFCKKKSYGKCKR